MNDKIAEKGLEFLETAIKMAQSEAPKLLSEFMNYMIFQTSLNMLQNMLWGILAYFIVKAITLVIKGKERFKSDLKETKTKSSILELGQYELEYQISVLKSLRLLVSVAAGIAIIYTSLPQVKVIGKIVLAPKLFLVEEGSKLLKK